MTIEDFSDWLSATAASRFIQVTPGIIPTLQTIHILCVAVLFTAALMIDLRILGGGLRSEPLRAVAERFLPSIWRCIAVLLLTGTLLILAEPARTLGNPAFYLKLCLLVPGILLTLALRAFAAGSRPVGPLQSVAAILSMLLWAGVIVAGRYIAYVS